MSEEMKKKFDLNEINKKVYKTPKKIAESNREIVTSKSDVKKKFYRITEFDNGVKKCRIVGMEKNGKMLWGGKK